MPVLSVVPPPLLPLVLPHSQIPRCLVFLLLLLLTPAPPLSPPPLLLLLYISFASFSMPLLPRGRYYPAYFMHSVCIYPAFSLSQDADCRRRREFYCPGVRQRCNAAKNVAEPPRGAEGERGGREEDARLDISVNTSRWNKRLEYRLVRVSLEKALERSRSSIVRRASSSPVLFPRYYRSAPLYRTYSRHLRLRGFFFATHVERRNIATSRATSIVVSRLRRPRA